MHRYDPEARVGLVVDKWGTWFDGAPDTSPMLLYQQNSLRGALVAAITLHLFAAHGECVRLTCSGPTVDVLQAMIPTQGPRMLRTPSDHAFEMFRVHQDAVRLPLVLDAGRLEQEGEAIPRLSTVASRDPAGQVHLRLSRSGAGLAGRRALSGAGEPVLVAKLV